MQLYDIHQDPSTNARIIGVYANKVNVAEGLTQICDIGHVLSVTWGEQYKASYVRTAHTTGMKYISHPLTMRHMCNVHNFSRLCSVVRESLHWLMENGYEKWCVKRSVSWENFLSSGSMEEIMDCLPLDRTYQEFLAEYLITVKRFDAKGRPLVTDDDAGNIVTEVNVRK